MKRKEFKTQEQASDYRDIHGWVVVLSHTELRSWKFKSRFFWMKKYEPPYPYAT